jgi:sulfite exporter TauE/SafE
MCGPLVVGMPAGTGGPIRFIAGRLLYNLGRVLTYVGFGALLGFVGGAIPLPSVQRVISVMAGMAIIVITLLPIVTGTAFRFPLLDRVGGLVTRGIGRMMARTSFPAMFALGFLNGLLPCGFVYLAIAGALASGGPGDGMIFMGAFGTGTVPAMFGMSLFPRFVSPEFRRRTLRVLPAFTLLVGILLILRGLNLGIPYVSPKLGSPAAQTTTDCCTDG